MALLNKFIWSRRKSQKQGYVAFGKNEGESWKPFNFSKEQVRVLLFRECDWRGRKLLFDSKAVQKVSLESETGSRLKFGSRPKAEKKKSDMYVEVSNGFGYQYLKPSSDVTVLGEMIFGSVAMTFQGTTFKVHSMKNPARLMCTKVFHSPISSTQSRGISDQSLEESFSSSVNSMNEFLASHNSGDIRPTNFESRPLDISNCELRVKQPSNSLEVDSGFYGDASLRSTSSISSVGYSGTSPDSRRSSSSTMTNPMAYQSGGSLASLQRRWLRNMSTSLEVGLQSGSWSSRSSTDDASVQHNHRRTKLGLAVIIDLSPEEDRAMELFSFEHMTLIEGILDRLRYCVEHAYTHKETFVHLMVEGCQDVQQWLVDVFCAPRLTSPVWLSLTSGANLMNSALTFNFLQDLCQLIARNDTKATNFFISTLLTAVLTHHLGWVATVLPGKLPLHHVSKKSCTGQMLHALSKSHPYNPLWAQLGDMYGALGYPTKVARTIVTSGMGKKADMLDKILNILSYFVRCGEVEKRIITEDTSSEMSSASTPVNIEAGKETENSIGPLSPALEIMGTGTECKDFTATLLGPPKFLYKSFLTSEDESSESRECSGSFKTRQFSTNGGDYAEAFAEIKENCVFFINNRTLDINDGEHQSNSIFEVAKSSQCIPQEMQRNDSNFNQRSITRNMGVGLKHSATLRNNLCNSLHEAQKCSEAVKDDNTTSLTEHVSGLKHNKTCTGDLSALVAETEEASMKNSQLSTVLPQTSKVHDKMFGARESVNPEQLSCTSNRKNGRLYPDLSDIASVDDADKSIASPLRMEEITEKVSRLCRVPASAIMYHLKESTEEKERDNIVLPKRIDCERQRSSPSSTSSSVASVVQRTSATDNQAGGKSPENSVKFILGDNEELVGLRSPTKSTNEDSEVITKISKSESTLEKENNNKIIEDISVRGSNKNVDSQHRDEIHGLGNKMCSASSEVAASLCRDCGRQESNITLGCHNSRTVEGTDKEIASLFRDISSKKNNRVVTVHSSVIELEYEHGSFKTNVEQSRKPVCRSLSVSYPISRERKSSRLCRRHSDCVHDAGRYLRDYHSVRFHFQLHDAALNGYVQHEKTEMESEVDKINGARGNFQHSNGTLLNCKHLPSKTGTSVPSCSKSNTSCSEEPACLETVNQDSINKTAFGNGCDKEENALFEDYNNLYSDENSAVEKLKEQSTEVPSENLRNPNIQELPLPSCAVERQSERLCGFSASLLGTVSDHYIPDFVLQGCTQLPKVWETNLRRDLSLAAHHSLLDQEVSEAVCIVANVDIWEVQLVSSHTYLVDKPGTLGVRVGMSRLVANMLESLLYLWKLKTSPEHCLLHLESKLRELCLRSQALAELLLTTEFCDMDTLTSSLDLDANDVPLLLAIASTHSPQVTERYGLSFR